MVARWYVPPPLFFLLVMFLYYCVKCIIMSSCTAEKIYEEATEEFGYEPDWIVDCHGIEIGNHGFIFRDGSIIDVGLGEDHRAVLTEDEWEQLGTVTYTIANGEADFRVYCYLSWKQAEVIRWLLEAWGYPDVYFDLYDCDGKYLGYKELDGGIEYSTEYISEFVNSHL